MADTREPVQTIAPHQDVEFGPERAESPTACGEDNGPTPADWQEWLDDLSIPPLLAMTPEELLIQFDRDVGGGASIPSPSGSFARGTNRHGHAGHQQYAIISHSYKVLTFEGERRITLSVMASG